MGISGLIIFLAIGALAGWLAGEIMKKKKSSILINMIIGVAGSFLGGIVFGLLGFRAYGLIGSIVSATVGAILLLYIIDKVKK